MATDASVLFQAEGNLVGAGQADVGYDRERMRRRRLWRLAAWSAIPAGMLWWRIGHGRPIDLFRTPHVDWLVVVPILFFVMLIGGYAAMFLLARRSPHLSYRPEQIDVRLADVVGIQPVKEEVVRSINLFLASRTFSSEMGGRARRGLLFEGAPGTGKTHIAKAMAAEAGVPFLFVSATSFQSMFYGATAGKIRSYFKALRKAALASGGAIGFIEEIDAIGGVRHGMGMTSRSAVESAVQCCGGVTTLPSSFLRAAPGAPVTNGYMSEGVGGVVNELLVQMQSFDEPLGMAKVWNALTNVLNLFLPAHRQIHRGAPRRANILLIAATNRADSLDPALIRPGRFDRVLHFDLPDQAGRRRLIDHFLDRKAHCEELDDPANRDALSSLTHGYTPVRIEQLLDEALVSAVRRGDRRMGWQDVAEARLTLEVGLGQPVGYTAHEKRLIATHEAGHATAAYLVAPQRRLDILSIIKRRDALGMLAHGDSEEVYTRSRAEMIALIQIALAGQSAEEIFFGDVSTGPSGDLLYATNVAAQMVGAAGMTGSLISFAAIQGSTFSDTNIVGRVLGDPDGRAKVESLLQEQKAVIKARLEVNTHLVEGLRDALLERNELIGRDIQDVLHAAGPPRGLAEVDVRDAVPAFR
ncbi:MAG TPA: AAA family ATPase [Mycobacteriales bacterium]|nr:AAA family ATPase [Mycobacteriales bacterium]